MWWHTVTYGRSSEGETGEWTWVASTLHTTSEHGVSSIITADAHTSAASSRLNWRSPGRFKWTRPFRRKKKYCFCACAITFQKQSTFLSQAINGLTSNIQTGILPLIDARQQPIQRFRRYPPIRRLKKCPRTIFWSIWSKAGKSYIIYYSCSSRNGGSKHNC
jgi:hypothetical protein